MKKVYIIDDDRDIVDSLSIVLQSAGYEVGSQNDDDQFLENVKAFKPDVLILDVMFPENDSLGFELARKIKTEEDTSKIPILMLSAVNEKGIYPGQFTNRDRDDSWLPVQEFVEKPINPAELLKKVQTLCEA